MGPFSPFHRWYTGAQRTGTKPKGWEPSSTDNPDSLLTVDGPPWPSLYYELPDGCPQLSDIKSGMGTPGGVTPAPGP
jgi:hypothetical protein